MADISARRGELEWIRVFRLSTERVGIQRHNLKARIPLGCEVISNHSAAGRTVPLAAASYREALEGG